MKEVNQNQLESFNQVCRPFQNNVLLLIHSGLGWGAEMLKEKTLDFNTPDQQNYDYPPFWSQNLQYFTEHCVLLQGNPNSLFLHEVWHSLVLLQSKSKQSGVGLTQEQITYFREHQTEANFQD